MQDKSIRISNLVGALSDAAEGIPELVLDCLNLAVKAAKLDPDRQELYLKLKKLREENRALFELKITGEVNRALEGMVGNLLAMKERGENA